VGSTEGIFVGGNVGIDEGIDVVGAWNGREVGFWDGANVGLDMVGTSVGFEEDGAMVGGFDG